MSYDVKMSASSYVAHDGLFPDYVTLRMPDGTSKAGEVERYFPAAECSMPSVGFVDAYEVFECTRCGERVLMGVAPKFCPNCRAMVV